MAFGQQGEAWTWAGVSMEVLATAEVLAVLVSLTPRALVLGQW